MSVTKYDVAQKAGVSHQTVSNVINSIPCVSEELRKRVLASIEELNYIPNDAARRLRSKKHLGRTNAIACLLSIEDNIKFNNPFNGAILSGIDRELMLREYDLFSAPTFHQLAHSLNILSKINPENVDGLIILGGLIKYESDIIMRISERVRNVVCVNSFGPLTKFFDTVVIDLERAGFEAVEYLSKLGHKRIGFIGDSKYEHMCDDRIKGYKKAIQELNLEYDEQFIEGERYGIKEGYQYMTRILERADPLPTAMFAGSDALAVGALNAIRDKGMCVPDDISIVGFNDGELAEFSSPALTTLRVYKEEMGVLGLNRLMERINNPNLKPVRLTVSAELVVRRSCSRPKER